MEVNFIDLISNILSILPYSFLSHLFVYSAYTVPGLINI